MTRSRIKVLFQTRFYSQHNKSQSISRAASIKCTIMFFSPLTNRIRTIACVRFARKSSFVAQLRRRHRLQSVCNRVGRAALLKASIVWPEGSAFSRASCLSCDQFQGFCILPVRAWLVVSAANTRLACNSAHYCDSSRLRSFI